MTPQEELSLREELALSPVPMRELEIREQLATPAQLSSIEPEKGYIGRIGEHVEERLGEVKKTYADYDKGDVSMPEAVLQVVGKGGAGTILDVIGETAITGAKEAYELLPESWQQTTEDAAHKLWDEFSSSYDGQLAIKAVNEGIESWNQYKKEKPQTAKNIEAVANIGILLAPAKTKAKASPTVLGRTSKYIDETVQKQTFKRRSDFVGNLITPKRTPKVKIAETARTAEKGKGPFKRSVVELSQREKEIAQEVYQIKNVTPKNSIQGNLNEIVKENRKLAKQLDINVGRRSYKALRYNTSRKIDDAVNVLVAENPVITGNAEIVARKVASKAKQIIDNNPPTPKGLLDSRKQLDDWIRKQKGQKIFDPELESSLSVAVREVRNTINNSIDDAVETVAVKNELRRQSLLFEAIENLGPKAAEEYNTAIGRAMQNMAKVLPFRDRFMREAGTAFGLGYVSGSERLAPVFAVGLGVLAAGKGVTNIVISPKTKKALSAMIKGIDRAILTSKNPSMIKQLRADRAVVIELMKNAEIEQLEQEE